MWSNKRLAVIGAVSQNFVYGQGGKLPWGRISADMRYFQEKTMHSTVVMGRGTWESLPVKFRPLPGRENIVITNTPDYVAEGAIICASVQQAVEVAQNQQIFCIGGHDIWYSAMAMPETTDAFITVVEQDFPVDKETRLAPELLDINAIWSKFYKASVIPLEQDSKVIHPPAKVFHWTCL